MHLQCIVGQARLKYEPSTLAGMWLQGAPHDLLHQSTKVFVWWHRIKQGKAVTGGTSRENRANFLLFRIIYFTSEGDRTPANNIRKALSYKKERRQGKKLKVFLKRSLISFLTSKMHNQRLHTPIWRWALMRKVRNRMRGEKPHPSQCSRPNRALKITYSF